MGLMLCMCFILVLMYTSENLLGSLAMSHVLTIRINDDAKGQLERLCEFTRRSKSFIAAEAIEEYLEGRLWMLEALEEGIEDRGKGNLVQHETVLSEWETKAGV